MSQQKSSVMYSQRCGQSPPVSVLTSALQSHSKTNRSHLQQGSEPFEQAHSGDQINVQQLNITSSQQQRVSQMQSTAKQGWNTTKRQQISHQNRAQLIRNLAKYIKVDHNQQISTMARASDETEQDKFIEARNPGNTLMGDDIIHNNLRKFLQYLEFNRIININEIERDKVRMNGLIETVRNIDFSQFQDPNFMNDQNMLLENEEAQDSKTGKISSKCTNPKNMRSSSGQSYPQNQTSSGVINQQYPNNHQNYFKGGRQKDNQRDINYNGSIDMCCSRRQGTPVSVNGAKPQGQHSGQNLHTQGTNGTRGSTSNNLQTSQNSNNSCVRFDGGLRVSKVSGFSGTSQNQNSQTRLQTSSSQLSNKYNTSGDQQSKNQQSCLLTNQRQKQIGSVHNQINAQSHVGDKGPAGLHGSISRQQQRLNTQVSLPTQVSQISSQVSNQGASNYTAQSIHYKNSVQQEVNQLHHYIKQKATNQSSDQQNAFMIQRSRKNNCHSNNDVSAVRSSVTAADRKSHAHHHHHQQNLQQTHFAGQQNHRSSSQPIQESSNPSNLMASGNQSNVNEKQTRKGANENQMRADNDWKICAQNDSAACMKNQSAAGQQQIHHNTTINLQINANVDNLNIQNTNGNAYQAPKGNEIAGQQNNHLTQKSQFTNPGGNLRLGQHTPNTQQSHQISTNQNLRSQAPGNISPCDSCCVAQSDYQPQNTTQLQHQRNQVTNKNIISSNKYVQYLGNSTQGGNLYAGSSNQGNSSVADDLSMIVHSKQKRGGSHEDEARDRIKELLHVEEENTGHGGRDGQRYSKHPQNYHSSRGGTALANCKAYGIKPNADQQKAQEARHQQKRTNSAATTRSIHQKKEHLRSGQHQKLNEAIMEEREKIIGYNRQYIRLHQKFPPTGLDFYKFVKEIGHGAFGQVYLAIHKLTGKFVAIKMIELSQLKDKYSYKKVFQEVYILKKIRHSNIIRLYEVFENKKHIMMVMEYAGGGDLYQLVKKSKHLSEDETKYIFKKIVQGIAHCHCRSVLHRDIKLDNILLDGEGGVKICDFGVSRLITKTDVIHEQCGTPAYLAPEMSSNSEYSGFYVDIWSLGILLYVMLQGTVPFTAQSMEGLFQCQMRRKINFPINISPEAKDLIMRMLVINPQDRISLPEILSHHWLKNIIGPDGLPVEGQTEDDDDYHDFNMSASFQRQECNLNPFSVGDQSGEGIDDQSNHGEITERCRNAINGVETQPSHRKRQHEQQRNNDISRAQQIGNINIIKIQNLFFNERSSCKLSYMNYCAVTQDVNTYHIDDEALRVLESFGYARHLVIDSLNKGELNHATCSYDLHVMN